MLKSLIKKFDEHAEEYIIAILLIALTIVMLLQIIYRYFFNAALSWPEEFSRYCFIYITFLTIGYCVKRESMLRLDIVKKVLPNRIGDNLELIIWATSLVFFGYMFFNSIELVRLTRQMARTSPSMGIPFYRIYIATVIGFGLGIIRTLQLLTKLIRQKIGLRNGWNV